MSGHEVKDTGAEGPRWIPITPGSPEDNLLPADSKAEEVAKRLLSLGFVLIDEPIERKVEVLPESPIDDVSDIIGAGSTEDVSLTTQTADTEALQASREAPTDPQTLRKQVEDTGLEVVASLKEGLENLTPGDISPPTQKNSLKVFQTFSNVISASGLKATDHVPVYGKLATCYLDLAEQGFNIDALCAEGRLSPEEAQIERDLREQFRDEISSREKNSDCSFEWLSLYCDRLTMLTTEPAIRTTSFSNYNAGFARYRHRLAQGDWKSHEGYIRTCETMGDQYVREKVSPLARSRVDYPNTIMLPYPFELVAKELFLTTPGVKDNHFWPMGFVLRLCPGDGGLMSPLAFFGHDDYHWRNTKGCFDQTNVYYAVSNNLIAPSDKQLKTHAKQGKELFIRSLNVIAEMLKAPDRDPDQMKMDEFFAFYLSHESTHPLADRFSFLMGTPPFATDEDFAEYGKTIENFRDDRYYKSSLPPAMLEKLEDDTAFAASFKEYALKFVEEFQAQLKAQDPSLNDAVREWNDFYSFADLELGGDKKIVINVLPSHWFKFYEQHKVFPLQRNPCSPKLVQEMRSPGAVWKNTQGETLVMPGGAIIDPDVQKAIEVEAQLTQQGRWCDNPRDKSVSASGTIPTEYTIKSVDENNYRIAIYHSYSWNDVGVLKQKFSGVFVDCNGDPLAIRRCYLLLVLNAQNLHRDIHFCVPSESLDDVLSKNPDLNIVMKAYGRDRVEIRFRDGHPCERIVLAADDFYKIMDLRSISSAYIRQEVTDHLLEQQKKRLEKAGRWYSDEGNCTEALVSKPELDYAVHRVDENTLSVAFLDNGQVTHTKFEVKEFVKLLGTSHPKPKEMVIKRAKIKVAEDVLLDLKITECLNTDEMKSRWCEDDDEIVARLSSKGSDIKYTINGVGVPGENPIKYRIAVVDLDGNIFGHVYEKSEILEMISSKEPEAIAEETLRRIKEKQE